MFEHDKYFYFVQIVPTTGTFSFRNYTDNEGNTYSAFSSLGLHFNDHKPFWITFSARERTYRATKDRKVLVSKNGDVPTLVKLYDYIMACPFVDGGKNLRGEPKIKLYDEVKDAKLSVDRKTLRIKAGNLVLEMLPDQLTEMAHLIGCFSDDPNIQKSRLLEYADQEPDDFMDIYNQGDREARSLIRKGVKAGVLKKQGKMIKWDGDVIGTDEDDAVAKLMADAPKLTAIKANVNKFK